MEQPTILGNPEIESPFPEKAFSFQSDLSAIDKILP